MWFCVLFSFIFCFFFCKTQNDTNELFMAKSKQHVCLWYYNWLDYVRCGHIACSVINGFFLLLAAQQDSATLIDFIDWIDLRLNVLPKIFIYCDRNVYFMLIICLACQMHHLPCNRALKQIWSHPNYCHFLMILIATRLCCFCFNALFLHFCMIIWAVVCAYIKSVSAPFTLPFVCIAHEHHTRVNLFHSILFLFCCAVCVQSVCSTDSFFFRFIFWKLMGFFFCRFLSFNCVCVRAYTSSTHLRLHCATESHWAEPYTGSRLLYHFRVSLLFISSFLFFTFFFLHIFVLHHDSRVCKLYIYFDNDFNMHVQVRYDDREYIVSYSYI